MIIAISGTPATGKTSVSRELAKKLNANLISVSELAKKKTVKSRYDKKMKTRIVDIRDIKKVVEKKIEKGRINIVDSHLSHLIRADIVVVLRTRPDVLEKRMKAKKWPKGKISENIKAEILDAATIEAISEHGKNKVIEIDTTGKSAEGVAALVVKLLNNHPLQKKYRPGRIDWSERFFRYLIK